MEASNDWVPAWKALNWVRPEVSKCESKQPGGLAMEASNDWVPPAPHELYIGSEALVTAAQREGGDRGAALERCARLLRELAPVLERFAPILEQAARSGALPPAFQSMFGPGQIGP